MAHRQESVQHGIKIHKVFLGNGHGPPGTDTVITITAMAAIQSPSVEAFKPIREHEVA